MSGSASCASTSITIAPTADVVSARNAGIADVELSIEEQNVYDRGRRKSRFDGEPCLSG